MGEDLVERVRLADHGHEFFGRAVARRALDAIRPRVTPGAVLIIDGHGVQHMSLTAADELFGRLRDHVDTLTPRPCVGLTGFNDDADTAIRFVLSNRGAA